MAVALLSAELINGLTPPARGNSITWDSKVVGLGIRITAGGARSFVFRYMKSGEQLLFTLGRFGPPPGLTLHAAREMVSKRKFTSRDGRPLNPYDPLGDARSERAVETIAQLCDDFLKDRADKRPATIRMYNQICETEIKPALGKRKVTAVEQSDFKKLHAEITARGASFQANRVVVAGKAMFNFAIGKNVCTVNPCAGIELNDEPRHDRYASEDELARLYAALDEHPDQHVADFFRLMLLCGSRISELLAATWTNSKIEHGVNLEAGTWIRPSQHTKQKQKHTIYLNETALQILRRMRTALDETHLFPRTDYEALKRAWKRILKAAAITELRRYDLRHTAGSHAYAETKDVAAVASLLGHTQFKTTERYIHALDEAKKAASNAIGKAFAGAAGKAPFSREDVLDVIDQQVPFPEMSNRLLRACRTLRALPDLKHNFQPTHNGWAEIMREAPGGYPETAFPYFKPSTADVSDCLVALSWAHGLTKKELRLIWLKSFGLSYRQIGFSLASERGRPYEETTARKLVRDAMVRAWGNAKFLTANDDIAGVAPPLQ